MGVPKRAVLSSDSLGGKTNRLSWLFQACSQISFFFFLTLRSRGSMLATQLGFGGVGEMLWSALTRLFFSSCFLVVALAMLVQLRMRMTSTSGTKRPSKNQKRCLMMVSWSNLNLFCFIQAPDAVIRLVGAVRIPDTSEPALACYCGVVGAGVRSLPGSFQMNNTMNSVRVAPGLAFSADLSASADPGGDLPLGR